MKGSNDLLNILDNSACDVIAIQETWLLDGNATYLSNIHNKYMYAAVSGVDCKARVVHTEV